MAKHLFRSSPPARTTPSSPSSPLHHAFAESSMVDSVERLQAIMGRWFSSRSDQVSVSASSTSVLNCHYSVNDRREAKLFVEAVRDLQSSMHGLVSVNPASEKLVHAQNLSQSAMKFLETEFDRILKANREYLDPESVSVRSLTTRRLSASTSASVSDSDRDGGSDDDDESRFVGAHVDAMDDLKMIADCMISTGYTKECLGVYRMIRRSVVNETLSHLGVKRLSFSQIQKMNSKILESKIKTWLRAVKYAVRTLFYGERILCDHVFSGSSSRAESCFAEITQEAALTLFGFPENVATGKRTPEKMFRTLDMYEAISVRFPEIESTFSFESTSAVTSQAANSLTKLADAVRSMMADFEVAIQKDASKSAVRGGGVHPLTSYVMNYLAFLSDYSNSITVIFADWRLTTPPPFPESLFSGCRFSSPVSECLARVIFLALCKIDAKAQIYKDAAQSYLFLANNLRYVVAKVCSSNLKLHLGEDWVAAQEAKVKQYAAKYEKLGWSKVLTSLPDDPTAEITPDRAKEILMRFNVEFESAYKKQRSWVVPDQNLRDEMKVSLARKIVSVYREFYEVNRVRFNGMSIVKYTPDDLGNYLSDLFFGTRG